MNLRVAQFEQTILFDFRYTTVSFALSGRAGACVPIHRLLLQGSFDPVDIERLTAAYNAALELLRLKDKTDPICELIAAKIIVVYRSGERDPARLCARALKELGVPIPG